MELACTTHSIARTQIYYIVITLQIRQSADKNVFFDIARGDLKSVDPLTIHAMINSTHNNVCAITHFNHRNVPRYMSRDSSSSCWVLWYTVSAVGPQRTRLSNFHFIASHCQSGRLEIPSVYRIHGSSALPIDRSRAIAAANFTPKCMFCFERRNRGENGISLHTRMCTVHEIPDVGGTQ